jgi:2-polyprenyl-6-hydroxyphenyl methylase / 3-demethylubiquinone-9 3-methyltransferase
LTERTEGTIDRGEIARFARLASQWWDAEGDFRPLHRINPVRLGFIREKLTAHFARDGRAMRPFEGLRCLDIGCGGGLVAEPMTRLGFAVTGIDADAAALEVAHRHAQQGDLPIDYRAATAEELAAEQQIFDVVLALEVIEHVADVELFLAAVARLVRPGGAFIAATLNRTAKSFFFAIVGAEYVLRWLPRGTHRWEKFVRPSEFTGGLRRQGLSVRALEGMVYAPGTGSWSRGPDLAVNYLLFATQPKDK